MLHTFAACFPLEYAQLFPGHIYEGLFYVRRKVDLMKAAKVNAYIMHIFGKTEFLSIHATWNYFKMHYFNNF